MSGQPSIVEAFRVMTANRSLSDEELHDLIRDGITAALTRHFNGPVEAEITILPDGDIKIVALKEVVEEVEESSCQISLTEARYDDPDFQLGDLLEIPVQFSDFGRNAVIVAKQRIVSDFEKVNGSASAKNSAEVLEISCLGKSSRSNAVRLS
jgi:N utilization substance protein A